MGRAAKRKEEKREQDVSPEAFLTRLTWYMNGLVEARRVAGDLLKYHGPVEGDHAEMLKTAVELIREKLKELDAVWTTFAEEHEL